MQFQSLRTASVTGKYILMRVDLNVPTQDGRVTDTTRIDRLKPTIDFLVQQGARTILLSHFGRPKGITPEFSQKFLTPALEAQWRHPVSFSADCIGDAAMSARNAMKDGDILLLENVRFHAEEEKNDLGFAKQLAVLGDIYVNDAFSAAHRAHASTEGLAHMLPAFAGFLMEEELSALNLALGNPIRPVAAIVGGAKVSTKLDLLNNLVTKVDVLVLGGGMANTFLHAHGVKIGKSLCEPDMVAQVHKIKETAAQHNCKIIIPSDVVVACEFKANPQHSICDVTSIPSDHMALDIGPQTVEQIKTILATCKTIIWNGPLGAFELPPFHTATVSLAQFVAAQTQSGSVKSVAGGGDTVAALEMAGVIEKMTYVSSAGGAFLEWMEGKTLPGVAALLKNAKAA
jgi:phosphoglycerate kinase